MIATYPTGNSYIHPGEKFPVAEYASLWALAKVYGQPVVHRANEYQKMLVKDGKVYLYFDSDPIVYERWKHIENNASWQVLPQPYQGNAPIEGFIIAGKDRRWYPAKAQEKRLDGTWTIEVWSDLVAEPVAVRYGWANWPTGNLVGRERPPAPDLPHRRLADRRGRELLGGGQESRQREDQGDAGRRQDARPRPQDPPVCRSTCRTSRRNSTRGMPPPSCAASSAASRASSSELQTDQWLSGQIKREHPEAAGKIEALQKEGGSPAGRHPRKVISAHSSQINIQPQA